MSPLTMFTPRFSLDRSLLGFAILTTTISAQTCTLCADGSPANLNGILADGSLCSDLNSVGLEISNQDEKCLVLQTFGFQSCGCPTQPPLPDDACRICPDGSIMSNPDADIVGVDATCGSIESLANALLGASACDFLPQLAYYCGCTNVKPTCPACSTGTAVSKPHVMIQQFNVTCGFVEQVASLSPSQTACNGFQEGFMQATDDDVCGCIATSDNVFVLPTSPPSIKPTITKPTYSPHFMTPTPLPTKGPDLSRISNDIISEVPSMSPTTSAMPTTTLSPTQPSSSPTNSERDTTPNQTLSAWSGVRRTSKATVFISLVATIGVTLLV